MSWIKKHKFLVIILLLAVLGLAYVVLQDSLTEIKLPTVSGLLRESGDDTEYQDAVRVLSDLRRISLDTSIFENTAFVSLFDFTRPLEPKPLGRRNPFLPIGQ
jgi:hypothetical protein